MAAIPKTAELLLDHIAAAMFAGERGFALSDSPFKRAISVSRDEIVALLTEKIEALSGGVLTVCVPADRLLHGYTSGNAIGFAVCEAGTSNPVAEQNQVKQAWFLEGGGLLPAAFDCMPAEADQYIAEMYSR